MNNKIALMQRQQKENPMPASLLTCRNDTKGCVFTANTISKVWSHEKKCPYSENQFILNNVQEKMNRSLLWDQLKQKSQATGLSHGLKWPAKTADIINMIKAIDDATNAVQIPVVNAVQIPAINAVYEVVESSYSIEEESECDAYKEGLMSGVPSQLRSFVEGIIQRDTPTDRHHLYELVVTEISKLWKQKSWQCKYFAIQFNTIKHKFNYFDQQKYNHGDLFVLSNGQFILYVKAIKYTVHLDIYNLLKLHTYLPPSNVNVPQSILKEDLHIAILDMKQSNITEPCGIFALEKPYRDRSNYQIKFLALRQVEEIIKEKGYAVHNIISKQISEQCYFYADLDIHKGNLEEPSRFIDDFVECAKRSLVLYNDQYTRIWHDIVGSERSCHFYTDALVKIDDLKNMYSVIFDMLQGLGYNKQTLKSIYDKAPYPSGMAYAQLRFPLSDKIIKENKKNRNVDDSDDERPAKNAYFANRKISLRFPLERYQICTNRPLETIITNPFFNNIKPFPTIRTRKESDSDEESDDDVADCNQTVEDYLNANTDSWHFKNNSDYIVEYQGDCPFCDRTHNNNILFVTKTGSKAYIKCPKGTETITLQPKKAVKSNDIELFDYRMEEEFPITHSQIKEGFSFNALSNKMTCVKAAPGAGKSYGCSQAIKELLKENSKATVLFLSTRISFSRSIVAQFREQYGIDFGLYDELDNEQLFKCQFLMIQVESLPRLGIMGQSRDLFIIDEAVSVVNQVSSGVGKETAILNSLEVIMMQSRHVIIADAFLTRSVSDYYLHKCQTTDVQYIHNSAKPYLGRIANIYLPQDQQQSQRTYYWQQLLLSLSKHDHVFSFISERRVLKQILIKLVSHGVLDHKQIIVIHGDNLEAVEHDGKLMLHSQQKRSIYSDISIFQNFKLVMYTKSLTCGIDSQLPFTCGVHLLSQKFVMPFEFVQAIHRFRKVQQQHVFIEDMFKRKESLVSHSAVPSQEARLMICDNSFYRVSRFFNDMSVRYRILKNTMDEQQRQEFIPLILSFLDNLGYRFEIERVSKSKQFETAQKDQRVKPLTLEHADIEICYKIRNQGSGNCEDVFASMDDTALKEIRGKYKMYTLAVNYVSLFKPLKEITAADIMLHQKDAIKSKLGSQLAFNYYLSDLVAANQIAGDFNNVQIYQPLAQSCAAIIRQQKTFISSVHTIDRQIENIQKAIFTAFLDIDGQKIANNVTDINARYQRLLSINDPYELFEQVMIITGTEVKITNKLVVEFIHKCGFQTKSVRVRTNGQRSRKIVVLPVAIPTQ